MRIETTSMKFWFMALFNLIFFIKLISQDLDSIVLWSIWWKPPPHCLWFMVSWTIESSNGPKRHYWCLSEGKQQNRCIKEAIQLSDDFGIDVLITNDLFPCDFSPFQHFTTLMLSNSNIKLILFSYRAKIPFEKAGTMLYDAWWQCFCTYTDCIIVLKINTARPKSENRFRRNFDRFIIYTL